MSQFLKTLKGVIGKLPKKTEIRSAINSFSVWQRLLFTFLLAIFIGSAIVLAYHANNAFLVDTPALGGELSEGLIGTPRFVNPVLALSDSDRDLTALIYSGLMRKDQTGKVVPDLAQKYDLSKDGLIYTFTLRGDVTFHDREQVSADDVVFTVGRIKDPLIKSPRRVNWEGVAVEKIDDRTVKFTLKQPFASFLENATIGILPAHLWKEIKVDEFSFIELNTAPVGSGPYKLSKIKKKSSGIPEYYVLESFSKYASGRPYIKKYTFHFYENEPALVSALRVGEIEQAPAISPLAADELKARGWRIEQAVLPRIFSLFLNHNQQALFLNSKVTEAIELSIDKNEIVEQVLRGYGVVANGPIPANLINLEDNSNGNSRLEQAKQILSEDGFLPNEEDGILEKEVKNKAGKKENRRLTFSISTGDAPELKAAAEILKKQIEQLGAQVEIKIFEVGSLNQDVIRPRKYEALLFGQIIGHESDLFAFWHSSQRNDPGLNIATYTSVTADKILEATLGNLDPEERLTKYADLQKTIREDRPAIFIYSPEFIYIVSKKLQGFELPNIVGQADRFLGVNNWNLKKDRVWKIFIK